MPAVEVAKVESMTLVDETQAVGSLRSRQGVMLRPEVGGRVKQILFSDGQRVRKGQLMVQFEDQLQQAQVAQARAELSIAEANHKRNQELVAQNFIIQRSLDESAAALEVSRAKLSLAQATLQRLQVLAPFDGITGLKQINVGDYLKDGADMVNVEDMDAVLVSIAQRPRGFFDVVPVAAREAADDGALDLARDRVDRRPIARRGGRKAGLDHIHAEIG